MSARQNDRPVLGMKLLGGIFLTSFVITALAIAWHLYDNYLSQSQELDSHVIGLAESAASKTYPFKIRPGISCQLENVSSSE